MGPKLDLVSFFEDAQGDYRGRKFSDILTWSDNELEASHDYIQTLFPLPEASQVVWSATTIDRRVFDAFHAKPELQGKLRAAFMRMLSFYGFEWLEDGDGKRVCHLLTLIYFTVLMALYLSCSSFGLIHEFLLDCSR